MEDEKLLEEEFEVEVIDDEVEAEKEQEVAEPVKENDDEQSENVEFKGESQSIEENSKFASMRKKIEAEVREKVLKELEAKTPSKTDDEIITEMAFNENITYEEAKKVYIKDKEINEMKNKLQEFEKKLKRTEINESIKSYKNKPHYQLIEKEFSDLVNENPDVDLNTAYHYLLGTNIDKINKGNAVEKTKAKAMKRNVETGTGTPSKEKVSVTASQMKYIKSRVEAGIFKNVSEGIKKLKEYD